MTQFLSLGALAGALLLVSTGSAHAYLDPGTGSMLLQGLIAGIAAGSVVLGRYWYKVKGFFSSAPQKSQREQSEVPKTDVR
jgi:hypothetical protein